MAYPTNPTSGDTYTLGSKTWTYNGTNWVNQATFASGSSASVAFSDLTSTPTTLAGYGITDGGSGGGGSVDPNQVAFPDWASPNSTYLTSGTWSKGSLADTDYVWIYMVDGGAGGNVTNTPGYVRGGTGGQAFLLYGQAQYFDGGAYVVGAGGAKGHNNNGLVSGLSGGKSSFTLSSANGSTVYVSNIAIYVSQEEPFFVNVQGPQVTHTATQISAQFSPTSFFVVPEIDPNVPSTYPTIPNILVRTAAPAGTSPIGWGNSIAQGGYIDLAGNSVFGGGGGGGKHAGYGEANAIYGGKSLYAGAGADYNTGNDGAVPGGAGGGGDNLNGSQTGNGGAGNMRVYHV